MYLLLEIANLFYEKRLLTTRYEIEIYQKSVYEISLKRINLENGSGIVLDAVAVFFPQSTGVPKKSVKFLNGLLMIKCRVKSFLNVMDEIVPRLT